MDDRSLASAIGERIRLVPYDPQWTELFELEQGRLWSLFPEDLLGVEHYGSTAVVGMTAKPIVDILAGVASMEAARALVPHLCAAGYTAPEQYNAGLADRQWLMRASGGRRTHHLTVVVHGSEQWQRRLAFRDILRADPEVATSYERLKRSLAARYQSDRETYTSEKTSFVRHALSTRAR